MLFSGKGTKDLNNNSIRIKFNNNNVNNSDYFTTSTFNKVVRSQVEDFYIMHENMRFRKNVWRISFICVWIRSLQDVIVLSETWSSANTCHDVQGYTFLHYTYNPDTTVGGVSVLIRNCDTSTTHRTISQ